MSRIPKFLPWIETEEGKIIQSVNNEWTKVDPGETHNIDNHTDIPTKPTTGKYIMESTNGTISWSPYSLISNRDIVVGFGDKFGDYCERDTNSWIVVRTFKFLGTDSVGTPSFAEILGYVSDSTYPGYVRIYDYTNGLIVAEFTLNSESDQSVIDNSLVNLPSDSAWFEIQIKADQNGKKVYLKSFMLGW